MVYTCSIGFFLEDAIEMLVKKKEKNFTEMLLHHTSTLGLIFFSHLVNGSNIGFIILWLHYLADIFVSIARAFNDVPRLLPVLVIGAVGLVLSWAYT